MVEIKEHEEEGIFELEVIGEVDASSSINLDNALVKAMESGKSILINLQQLQYISSAGLGVFISYLEELKTKQTKLVFYGLTETVIQVFEILGLHELFEICDSKESASAKLNEA